MEVNKIICGDSIMVTASLFHREEGGSIPTSPHQLVLMEIDKSLAKECYKKWHYLGVKDFVSSYNFGVFYGNRLWGCITFKPPSAEETIKGLFGNEDQRGHFEIGRFALSDSLPKNSESRVISIAIRLLRKSEKIKSIITYADTAFGHGGTIYRATGFQYKGLTKQKSDFWVNGKIKERGRTKGLGG